MVHIILKLFTLNKLNFNIKNKQIKIKEYT